MRIAKPSKPSRVAIPRRSAPCDRTSQGIGFSVGNRSTGRGQSRSPQAVSPGAWTAHQGRRRNLASQHAAIFGGLACVLPGMVPEQGLTRQFCQDQIPDFCGPTPRSRIEDRITHPILDARGGRRSSLSGSPEGSAGSVPDPAAGRFGGHATVWLRRVLAPHLSRLSPVAGRGFLTDSRSWRCRQALASASNSSLDGGAR